MPMCYRHIILPKLGNQKEHLLLEKIKAMFFQGADLKLEKHLPLTDILNYQNWITV